MNVTDPLIGQTIGGYRIVGLVGRGGMGSVYRARDEDLRRDIALKLLRLDDLAEEREAERFRREARLAAALSHPNIVSIHGTGSEAGYLYLAMELVEGQSLRQRLRDISGACPVDEALGIAEQVLQALSASHAAGIVHRDIKPENILIRPDGTVKVLDFGVARLEGGTVLTRADELLGTVEYMAPEQVLGDTVGPASDLYAAGVVLYEMLTGSQPFAAESAATLVYHQLNEVPPSPSLLNPAVSRALDTLLLALLDKLPENRPGTAGMALGTLRDARQRQQVATLAGDASATVETAEDAPGSDTTLDHAFRFTGRQSELETLEAHVAAASEAGRLVFLAGEAGIGKTRIAHELCRRVEQSGSARPIRGVCFFEHGMGPYMPFLDAIANLFHEDGGRLTEEERAQLTERLREQAPGLAELTERSSTTAKVRAGFAAAFGSQNDPDGARQRFFDAVFDLLAAAAACKPLVVILEDLHWADEGSLRLLNSVARRCAEAPILWVVTYRSEELGSDDVGLGELVKQLGAEGELNQIELSRFDRDVLERMVRSAFPTAEFTDEFGEYLFDESQGNPLVAAEVVNLLRGRDLLYRDSGVWTVRPGLPSMEVPGRVQALISQRLDQLDDEHRELLQVAAVLGQRFTSDVLGEATGTARIALLKALFRLERQHRLLRSDDDGYEFSHSTIREVLYGEIPRELRREYHAIVAGVLEARATEDSVADEQLGLHLHGAGEYGRALPYLYRAAEAAFLLFAWRPAADMYDRACDAARRSDAQDDAYLRALRRSARVYGYLTAYDEAQRRCDMLREVVAQRPDDPLERAGAWKLTGELLEEQRRYDEAEEAYATAAESLEGVDAGGLADDLQLSRGFVDFEVGRYDEARRRWEAAVAGSRQQRPALAANALNNLAVLHTMQGNLDEAWTMYEQVLALDADGVATTERMMTWWNMGMLRADQERWDEALELYDRSLDACRQTRYYYHEPTVELNRAEALLGKGDLGEARRTCTRALRGCRRLDDHLGVADSMRLYGRLCRLERNYEDGRTYLERSIEMNRQVGESVSLGEALYEMSLMQRDQGQSPDALVAVREAEHIFEAAGAAVDLGLARDLRAELEAA